MRPNPHPRALVSLSIAALLLAFACASQVGAEWPPQAEEEEVRAEEDLAPPCLPQCDGRSCGDDGCGGSCGSCFSAGGGLAPELCTPEGTCCAQQCAGKVCGDDGCGGICGECGEWGECIEGACHYTPGWTILVYAMGDNDLEGSMIAQFNQLMTVGSNENLNIIVQLDGIEGMAGRSNDWPYGDVKEVKRFRIDKGNVVLLEELPELDSADPKNLADFIAWGVNNYPARRYAIILDDHGGGYTGIGSDWTNESWMPLPDIALGLKDGLEKTNIEKFDFLFFYACLMGNFEVAHAIQPHARYMLASEELAIGASFRLDRLQLAYDDPDVDAETLARAIMREYVPTWSNAYPDVTVSLVDLTLLPRFEAALATFLDHLREDLEGHVEAIMLARNAAEKFAHLPFGFMSMQLMDLGGFLQELTSLQPDLQGPAAAMLEAYDAIIVDSDAGPGHPAATGLSVFFPPSLEYYDEVNEYNGSSPGQEYEAAGPPAVWSDFLVDVLELVTIQHMGPMFACFAGDPNPLCEESSSWLVEGEDDFSLSRPIVLDNYSDDFKAWMLFGSMPSGWMSQIDFYSQFPAAIDPETGMVSGSYDYHRLVLRQFEKESFAYWRLTEETGETRLTVPFVYLVPGSQQLEHVEWRTTVDPADWSTLESAWFVRLGDGSFEEFDPANRSKLYPAVLRLDMQWYLYGWEPLYTAFDATKEIAIAFEPLAACNSYMYGLAVEDSAGRSDVIIANVCKAEGIPTLKITVNVEAEGPWDESDPPDFVAHMLLNDETPVDWEVVPDSHSAKFQTEIDYTRWMPASLTVGEMDGDDEGIFLEKDVTKYLYQADWFCSRSKVYKHEPQESPLKATVTLIVEKCP